MTVGEVFSPLALEGWMEFNKIKNGVQGKRNIFMKENSKLPSIEAIFYYDNKNRIVKPLLNPYIAINFNKTSTDSNARIYRQWLDTSKLLTDYMFQHSIRGKIPLSPGITDLRPWIWKGYKVDVQYTFYIDFPFELNQVASEIRTKISKAKKNGFVCQRSINLKDVLVCLEDTEYRQGFTHGLTLEDLELARSLLGDEYFRCYVCYSDTGEPVSTEIELHYPGCRAIGWVAGTKSAYLNSGVTQLRVEFVLDDLYKNGATGFDHCGANIINVAAAKSAWGSKLVPYYTIAEPHPKESIKAIRDYYSFKK